MYDKPLDLYDYFGKCRNTRVITNKRGDLVPVSCNKCPDCLNRKSSRYIALCNQESSEHRYTEFITLTYNYLNLPIVKLVECEQDKKFIRCIDVTRRLLHYNSKYSKTFRKSSSYGQEIHRINCSLKNDLFRKFYKKSRFHSKLFKRKKFRHLYVLNKEDLQKFIKRLRFQVAKDFDSEIRFFAVGEYSPIHFLPHYHVILYHNDERFHKQCQEYVNKCWQYGFTSIEPAKSIHGVSSYVSGYTNSFTKLPIFLNGSKIKPFSIHSQRLGQMSNYELASTIYEYERIPFEDINYQTSLGLRTFSLSCSSSSYFFPKCYNFLRQSNEGKLILYTAYEHYSKRYNTKSVVDICKYILLSPFKTHNLRFLKYLELVPLDTFHPRKFYDAFETGEDLTDEFHLSVFSKIYNAVLLSKHFYLLTQCDYFRSMPQYKRNSVLLFKINDFYSQKDYMNLITQLLMQQEYYLNFGIPDYSLFFPIGSKQDYGDIFKNSNLIKHTFFLNDIKYNSKVKHKELNDQNGIFCQNIDL